GRWTMKKSKLQPIVGLVAVVGTYGVLVVATCTKIAPLAVAHAAQSAPAAPPASVADRGMNEILCPGCPAPKEAAEKKDVDKDKKVKLTDKVMADAHVKTDEVKKEAIVSTVTVPGEIVADPDKSARLTSPVGGRLERVAVKEGDEVKKGDVL